MSTIYKRTFETALDAGSQAWSMRSAITNPDGDLNFSVGSGSTQKIIIGFRGDGTLVAYDDDTTSDVVLVPALIANRNYRIEVEWDDAAHPDQFRARVDLGVWTAWLGVVGTYSTMDAVFMENASTSTGIFYVDAFNAPAGTSGIIDGRWLLGARIYLKSATQYIADDYIRMPTAMYLGEVLDWGFIERSIPAPCGPARVGDCLIRIADTENRWRDLFATQTGLGRLIEIFRVSDGAIIGGFETTGLEFPDGALEVRGSDILAKWLDRPIPMLGTRENFPWMMDGVDEFFMPIIFGRKFSSGSNPQGMIRPPHMGPTTKVTGTVSVDRYSVSRLPTFTDGTKYLDVYRKLSTDEEFSLVDDAEYVITIDEPFVSDGVTYSNPTYLDFLAEQNKDTEIHIDPYGADRSAAIGGLPEFQSETTDPLRNPIDFLTILMVQMSLAVGGDNRPDRYNTTAWLDVRDYCASLPTDYACDLAITTPVTFGNVLAQWQSTFQIDFFVDRHYQYTVALTHAENTSRPVLTDLLDFVSIRPKIATDTKNRYFIRYDPVPVTGEWAGSRTYDNEDDQAELGDVDYQGNVDTVQSVTFDCPYTSELDTALNSALRASAFQSLGSHGAEISVPTPRWFEPLELAGQIGVTHARGIGGPWNNVEMKVLSLRHDLSGLLTTVTAIRRLPVTY